jgi:DNA-binding MarR family transcriptional regulator
MAMDVNKVFESEKKPDVSFLKLKKTKPRSEIQSPFGAETGAPDDSVNKLASATATAIPATSSTEHLSKYVDAQDENQAPERVLKVSLRTPSNETASSPLEANNLSARGQLHSLVQRFGHTQTIHLLLLLEITDKDGEICKSYNEIADHLSVSRSSVKRLLGDFISKGILKKKIDAHPGLKTPATHVLSAKAILEEAILSFINRK